MWKCCRIVRTVMYDIYIVGSRGSLKATDLSCEAHYVSFKLHNYLKWCLITWSLCACVRATDHGKKNVGLFFFPQSKGTRMWCLVLWSLRTSECVLKKNKYQNLSATEFEDQLWQDDGALTERCCSPWADYLMLMCFSSPFFTELNPFLFLSTFKHCQLKIEWWRGGRQCITDWSAELQLWL